MIFGLLIILLPPCSVAADGSLSKVHALIQDACIPCHDTNTDTGLDLSSLGLDLENDPTFRAWVKVYDRVQRGEMPPASADPPSEDSRQAALAQLEFELAAFNRDRQQTQGRVPSRRLTRQEYENTLHDLLGIGGNLAQQLPPESKSGSFDVVATSQEMSSIHVKGLLVAASAALDEAIELRQNPNSSPQTLDYFDSPYIQMWVDRPVRRGGGTIFKTDQDVVTFRGENFVFRSSANGFRPAFRGRYRVRIQAAAHQPRSSITLSLKRQNDVQGDSALIAAWDLVDETNYREVETVTYLRPDDDIYVSADELDPAPDGRVIYNGQPASTFGGEGVKIHQVTIEGPLESEWPPHRTQALFPGVDWKISDAPPQRFRAPVRGAAGNRNRVRYQPIITQTPTEHVRELVANLAPKAFRREVSESEIDALTALAMPSLEANEGLVRAARIPMQAILMSPQLLYLSGAPGPLDDHELASRLSYFLWRSLPDEELSRLARRGVLSQPRTLNAQIDRMLDDRKFDRFVFDFLDQWLDLDRIDATTPDVYLYPEYDDVLRMSMLSETRQFFKHLIDENLTVANLIDSDFTFLNRRLAEHYGVPNVQGEHVRKVALEPGSVRGGILSHASIAKVTANGTTTTPVKRGNFVLTNLLGLSPRPPPPGVGSIEPDTRAATTIREMLHQHQSIESCAACHRSIDPPGFAMECFDPVGTFRQRYRNSKGVQRERNVGLRFLHKDYELGPKVDPSGTTEDGFRFDDFRQFKQHLIGSTEQVARNLVSRLMVFATGGEIEFVDRAEIERILALTREDGYPVRSLIYQVIESQTFRNR